MKKDIIDLIKEQGNQACVMMPDIMTTPAIDLGEVTINAGVESIELSTDQKQQLMGFLDKYKNNSLFLLQVKTHSEHYKLLMTHSSEIENTGFNFSMYASNPVNITISEEQVSIYIFVITFTKTKEQQDVFFGIKTLK